MPQSNGNENIPRPLTTGNSRQKQFLFFLLILIALGVILHYLGRFLGMLNTILIPILFASIIAYVLDPLIDRFEARKINRTLAIVIVLVLFLGFIVLFLIFFIPSLNKEIGKVIQNIPNLIQGLEKWLLESVKPWFKDKLNITLPNNIINALNAFQDEIKKAAPNLLKSAGSVAQTIFSSSLSFLSYLFTFIITALFAFYFLKDFDKIKGKIFTFVPVRYQTLVAATLTEIDAVLSSFIRGQLTVCVILGTLYSIGLSICGIPVAVGIGILSGALNIIPYFGMFLGLCLSILMALLDFSLGQGSLLSILGVVIVFAGVNLADGLFITPNIVGQKVGLNPVVVIMVLLAGGAIAGLLGILLAVPITAVLKIVLKQALAYYKRSQFYLAPEQPKNETAEK